MSKRTLAIVVKYFPPYPRISGVLTFVALLAEEMADDHEVHVVTSALPDGLELEETVTNATVHRVGWPFPVAAGRAVRRLRPDVTLTVSGVYDLRIAAAYFLPVRASTPRSSDHFFYQATWPQDPPGRVFRAFAGRYTGLAVASDGIHAQFSHGGLASEVIAPAVDVRRLASLRRRAHSGPLRVGFVNHLNEVKGADIASEVISELRQHAPEMTFLVAGAGDLEESLRERHGGDERIEMLGFLPEEERLAALASCDVMLLPFRQATSVLGVSQTALEVMALGNVVVGTRTESLQGAVVDGANGVLVDASADVGAAMVRAVLDLDADRSLLERLRATAADHAQERWDIARRGQDVPTLLGLTTT